MDENKNSKEDLVTLRNYTLGVVAFATAVSTLLIQVLHFRVEPTIACTLAFACMMLLIVYLIGRAESRNQLILRNHIDESDTKIESFDKRLDSIDSCLLEIQRSTLRTELNNAIFRHPENHDSILKMAEKYFGKPEDGGLNANWYMSSVFLDWAEKEKVKLPISLQDVKRD